MTDFYARVKRLQKERKINDAELSRRVGLTQAGLAGWKVKDSIPRADVALKAAEVLCTSVEYLITGKKDDQLTERESIALSQLKSLNDVNRNAVFTLIDGLYKQEQELS